MDLKQAAISIAMIVFVLSSMLGMGLGLRVSEIVAPLRNSALVVAGQSFEDPSVGVMVVVVAIVGLLTLMPLSRSLGRGVPPASPTAIG